MHIEYMKMLKEEVRHCYRREGVNHYETCSDLVGEYVARTKDPQFRLPKADELVRATRRLLPCSLPRRCCLRADPPRLTEVRIYT